MDIASLSTAMSTQNILNDVGTLMLSKSLDTAEDMGEGMIKIMESSVTPYLGQNIDYYV
ncbi:MAG: YjfB family protein [Lachnospira sp.]|nr:YjfB family protein [Lachnospira sp.]